MQLKGKKNALLLIDIQKGLDQEEYYGGNRNNKYAEQNAARILSYWRKLSLPIFHIQHSSQNLKSPLHSSSPGFAIKDEVQPIKNEPIIVKNVNSAFIGTDLEEQLQQLKIDSLIIVGLTTNHCISTTARMAGNLGFKTIVISDATATFDRIGINGEKYSAEIIHLTTLANLQEEFATVFSTQQLFSLIQS